MARNLVITLHAAAGVIAFGAGCDAVVRRRWFRAFFWSLVAMVGFLLVAIALDWPALDPATRTLFVALLGLGGWMIWRATQARRILRMAPDVDNERSRRYIRHIGFNLVALFDGFVVVTVFNGGVPGWAAAVVGSGVAVAGHLTIGDLERRHAASSAPMTVRTPTRHPTQRPVR
jgi:hypothetical protein